jgi:DNA processing protein
MLLKNELLYTLALQRVVNLGDISAKKLLHKIGSAEAIFTEKKSHLLKVDGVGNFKLKNINKKTHLIEAEKEIKFIEKNNISFSYFMDEKYPTHLKNCIDGPILIFSKGNIRLHNKKILSIVGTRKITTYGKLFCENLIEELTPLHPVIVSGYAYGVDIMAHKTSIKQKLQTVACLAHGMNQTYPKAHGKYNEQVLENGGFITEFWSNDAFDRTNFLRRNRIIAGLSEATIVIESAEKGGSLVTADIANSYHREVFAVPGRSTDSQSQGCNNLIKTQQAHLLHSAADIIYHLGWQIKEANLKPKQTSLFVELTTEEKTIYNILKENKSELLDAIAIKAQRPTYKVATLLLDLELKGLVQPLPGKVFKLI